MDMKTLQLAYLDKLSSVISECTDSYELRKNISHILDYHQVFNYGMSYNRQFWRARKCKTGSGFDKVNELGHPPPEFTVAGRLNEENAPILYLSNGVMATLTEIDAQKDDFVHIVAFEQLPGEFIQCAMMGEFIHMHRWGSGLTSDAIGEMIKNLLDKMPYDFAKSFLFTDAFLSSIFKDKLAKDNGYIHSKTLASLIFEKNPEIDAITYSGVDSESSRNLAIKPMSANRSLRISATFVIKITDRYKFGIYDFDTLRNAEGVDSDGTILW